VESVALKDGLLALLESPAPVTLEINAVQRIDTAGMQLLTAFVRERESQGRQVRWRGSAPALSAAAALLGLAAVLRLPDQAP
jgi:ABC-type transporter Mla MlaB component